MTANERDILRLEAQNQLLDDIAERLRACRDWFDTGLDTLLDDRPHNGILLQRRDTL